MCVDLLCTCWLTWFDEGAIEVTGTLEVLKEETWNWAFGVSSVQECFEVCVLVKKTSFWLVIRFTVGRSILHTVIDVRV